MGQVGLNRLFPSARLVGRLQVRRLLRGIRHVIQLDFIGLLINDGESPWVAYPVAG